mmetsp:Transcript_10184/g.13253  ORF Transcript_10184/g.13253 Transcript_10184/m.13253 type:complete len:590 (-) Transcript_10184:66-1835(-)
MVYPRKNKGLLRMPRWKLLKWATSLGILIHEHFRPSYAFTADSYWQEQQQSRRKGGAGIPFNCRRSAFEVYSHSTEAAASSGNAPLNDSRRRTNSHHESLLMGTIDSRVSPSDSCAGEESSRLSGKKGFGAWVRSRRLPFRDRHRDRQGDPTVISSHIHHQQHPSVEQLQHSATELKASSSSFIPEPEVGQGSILNWEDLLEKFYNWYIDNHKAIGNIQDEKILERAFKDFLQSLQEVSSYTADQLANDVFILKKILDSEIVIPGLVGLVSTTNFFNDQVEPLQPIVVDSMASPTSDKLSKPVLNSLKDDSFVDVDETAYRTMVENALYNRLSRWTDHMRNVNVQARPRDRFLYRSLLRMTIESDLRVDFDRLAFPNLKISAGGRIDVNGCSISVPSILPHIGQIYPGRRFVRPFEFHATNCTLTQDDVLESPCIINGLQTLLNRILQRYAYSTAKVETVQIIDSKKISCEGFAKTAVGVRVPFEVRSGLSVSGNGHVLKFPGLEIAFGPFRKIFMPVIPTIDVDIGANAKIESLEIHGMRKMIKISARATVSPEKAMTLFTYRPKKTPETIFKVDVGDFVTNLGNFDK